MQTTPPAAAEAAEVMLMAGLEEEANASAEVGKADTPKEAGATEASKKYQVTSY